MREREKKREREKERKRERERGGGESIVIHFPKLRQRHLHNQYKHNMREI